MPSFYTIEITPELNTLLDTITHNQSQIQTQKPLQPTLWMTIQIAVGMDVLF